jgi:DNA repair exonuclease SbcCD ATPase subunit
MIKEIFERGRAKKMKIKVYAKRIMSNGEVTVSEAKEDPIREKETAKVIPQNTSGTPVGKLKLNIHTEMKDAHQNNNRHQNYNNNHNNNNQRNNGNNGYQRGIVRDKGNTIIRANTSRSEEFTKKSLEETQTVYKKVPLTIDKVSTYTFAPVDYDVENGVLSLKALEDNSIAISTEIKKYPEYIDMIATSANYTRSIEEELEYAKADLHQKEDACILLQRANDELKKQIEEQSDSNASEDSTSINDLNNTIKELSENIETLKAENKDLGDAISQMTTELEESGKSYESDQMLLKKLRAEVENLRAQKENLTNMLSDANDKLEAFGADTTDVFRESPEDLAAIAEMPVIDQYQAYSEEFKNIEAELTSFNDLSEENEYTKNHRILSCKPRHDQPEYILDADGKILTIVSINGIAIDDLAIIGKSEYEELKSEDSNRTEEPVDEESTMESVEAPVGSVQQ